MFQVNCVGQGRGARQRGSIIVGAEIGYIAHAPANWPLVVDPGYPEGDHVHLGGSRDGAGVERALLNRRDGERAAGEELLGILERSSSSVGSGSTG